MTESAQAKLLAMQPQTTSLDGSTIIAQKTNSDVLWFLYEHNLFSYCYNNPVMFSDFFGSWPSLSQVLIGAAVVAGVVAVAALCVATAGVAAGVIAGISGGAAVLSGGTATGLIGASLAVAATAGKVVLAATGAAVVADAAEKAYKNLPKNHTVYGLQNKDTGQIEYVGRTTDPAKRARAHKKNPMRANLEMVPLATGLNAIEARGVEQIQMLAHHTINIANRMNNQINGISPFNSKLHVYGSWKRSFSILRQSNIK